MPALLTVLINQLEMYTFCHYHFHVLTEMMDKVSKCLQQPAIAGLGLTKHPRPVNMVLLV